MIKLLTITIFCFFGSTALAEVSEPCDFLYKEYGKLRSALDWSKDLPTSERLEFLRGTSYNDLITSMATLQTLISGSKCRITSKEKATELVDSNIDFIRSSTEAIRRAVLNNQRLIRNLPIDEYPVLEHLDHQNAE